MQPCQQCDGGDAVAVWIAALLMFTMLIAWKKWPGMAWAGRVGMVAACIVAAGGLVVAGNWRSKSAPRAAACGTCVTPGAVDGVAWPTTRPVPIAMPAASEPADDELQAVNLAEVVVFYFHRTARCPSCLQIEVWAKQAVETGFAAEMAAGRVAWQAVNVDEPANDRFVQDYALTTQSLVFVRVKDGQRGEWKQLESVWELLGDYQEFVGYVQTELSQFLGGDSGT